MGCVNNIISYYSLRIAELLSKDIDKQIDRIL